MKIKIQLTVLLLFISIVGYGQALRTIRTYFPYSGGKLSEIYTVINDTGLKHGTYTSYNENGNLELVTNFKKNVRHGQYVEYDPSRKGIIKRKGNFLNGEQHGTWTRYVHASTDIDEISVYDNGERISTTSYYSYGEDRKKSITNKNGISVQWYENGKKKTEGNNIDGRWNGIVNQWYENGNLESSISYSNGIATDSAKYYYPTGTLKTIKRNDKDGNFRHIDYYPSGFKYQEIQSTPQKNYITIRYDSIDQKKIVEFEQTNEQYTTQSNQFISKKTYTEDGVLDRMTDTEDFIYKYRPDESIEWKLFPKEKWYTDYNYRDNLGSRSKDYFCRKFEDYDKDGKLIKSGTVDDKNGLDIEYVIYENDKIIERGSRDKDTGFTEYTIFDNKGQIEKKAIVDKSGNEAEYTLYENGIKIKAQLQNGDIYCYDRDKIMAYLSKKDSLAYLFYDNGMVEQIEDTQTGANVYFYPNGTVKSKGYLKDGDEAGVWYYYSSKGKLSSIQENGIERKPTKEDKVNHEAFLLELIHKRK